MIKDSGKRVQMAGMVRDVTDGKTKYHLVFDGPMFERWAAHLTEGAKKYGERNWQNAHSQEELDRFRESAVRHFIQWLRGDTDEDHAAALFFNVNGVEYVSDIQVDTDDSVERRVGEADRRQCNREPDSHHYLRTSGVGPKGRRKTDTKNYGNLPNCEDL